MPFNSSEIRWFSNNRDLFWNIYYSAYKTGEGTQESKRTDYYLKSKTINSGIKIREGNHEIKVKSNADEKMKFGKIESWTKWSVKEEENLVELIDQNLLEDWMRLEKIRYKKKYEIFQGDNIKYTESDWITQGCGFEFTEFLLIESGQICYTLGLEAFSSTTDPKKTLLKTMAFLNLDLSILQNIDSYGYPEFLSQM